MNRKLYVGNLPFQTTEADLETLFASAGDVATITVMRDRETGRARGFAFVEMSSDEGAAQAVDTLNNSSYGGRNLQVNEARPQQPRAQGFGGPRQSRRAEPRW
jgi:RNA recognition motif-containing protein